MRTPRRCPRPRSRVTGLAAIGALALALAACSREPPPDPRDAAAAPRVERDVRVLAGDAMAGRLTASAGYDRAAAEVARRMRGAGLAPGTPAGFLQAVPLRRVSLQAGTLVVDRAGQRRLLHAPADLLPDVPGDGPLARAGGPAVFVGYGVHAPALGHDDLAGLPLRGRIAVLLPGTPPGFDAEARAVYGDLSDKLAALAGHGAIGAVWLEAPGAASAWPAATAAWDLSRLRLPTPAGEAPLPVSARLHPAQAGGLLGRDPAPVLEAARAGRPAGFALPGTLELSARARVVAAVSHNVVGRLPGRDPALRDRPVVVSAHLDHLGTDATGTGDRIHNGALDNALGVAVMLEAARQLAARPQRPRRPVEFVAFTGEEQGRLGSRWFVAHPATGRPVAGINLDMPVLLAPTRDVVAVGAARSTLAAPVAASARAAGLVVSDDPLPAQAMLVRSDQYSFVRAGVPAVYLAGGVQALDGSDGRAVFEGFMTRHYHRVDDDARQPIRYADAARLARLAADLAWRIAEADAEPAWRPGDPLAARFAVTTGTGPAAATSLP